MGELYHGSSQSGIKRLEPRASTHGTYVYATPYKELAIIFSGRSGDDLTYSLYRNGKDQPWQMVERIPKGFETMFSNESSIYTLSDETFKDINTGFAEVVSEVGVDTLKEERLTSVYDAIKELEKKGLVETYTFPNKPNDIPKDDFDLINGVIRQSKRSGRPLEKRSFQRLLYLHPDMLDLINNELSLNGIELFTTEDIVEIFEEHLIRQIFNPLDEEYIKSAFLQISSVFPELIPQIKNKVTLIDKDKNGKIVGIIDHVSKKYPSIPAEVIEQLKNNYKEDDREFNEIKDELKRKINELKNNEEKTLNDVPKQM